MCANNNNDIEDLYKKLVTYRSKIQTLGFEVQEFDFAACLLGTLPDSWSTFVLAVDLATLSAWDREGVPTWGPTQTQALVTCILEEAQHCKPFSDGQDTALSSKHGKYNRGKWNKNQNGSKNSNQGPRKPLPEHNNGNCFHCNKLGHIAANCFKNPN